MKLGIGRAADRRSRRVTPLLCCALSATVGCESSTIPEGGPGYTGEIEAVDPSLGAGSGGEGPLTKVWVRYEGDECGLIFSVWEDETVLQHADGRAASILDFEPGAKVDVWHAGLVETSCPGQTSALAITLR